MNARRDPDRLIHAFLMEGQTDLADQVYDAVRAAIEQKRQRVVVGPWRTPIMNKLVPIGLGAAALVVALVVGTRLLGPPAPAGPGGAPSAEPSATAEPSVAAPSTTPSQTPTPAPPLTETFTSERHGISISYPTGWVTRPAAEPWTSGIPDYARTDGDVIYHPTGRGNLWIVVASQPQTGKSGEEWVDDLLRELVSEDFCESPLEDVAIDVDGAQGRACAPSAAAVSADDRGYLIMLYVSADDPAVGVTYDRAWFEEVLATVQLHPDDGVDGAPPASP